MEIRAGKIRTEDRRYQRGDPGSALSWGQHEFYTSCGDEGKEGCEPGRGSESGIEEAVQLCIAREYERLIPHTVVCYDTLYDTSVSGLGHCM